MCKNLLWRQSHHHSLSKIVRDLPTRSSQQLLLQVVSQLQSVVAFRLHCSCGTLGLAKCHHQRIYGTALKRLIFGFTVSTVPNQIIVVMNLRYYYHPDDVKFCQADGFLFQYLAAVGLLFTAGISLVLFFKVWEVANPWKPTFVEALNLKKNAKECTFICCARGWKVNKLEVAAFVSVFSLPLLFDWIPFVTNSYGSTRGPICWLYSLKSDCSINEAGLWEQIWLWNVPYGFVALLTILLFVVSFCLLKRGFKNAKFQKLIEVDFLTLLSPWQSCHLHSSWKLHYFSFQDHRYAIWGSYLLYLSNPLSSTFIPITLLFAIHLPLSSMIVRTCSKYQRHNLIRTEGMFDQATFNCSICAQQPSHTSWNPPHSSNEDSEIIPFAKDRQQEYGNMN